MKHFKIQKFKRNVENRKVFNCLKDAETSPVKTVLGSLVVNNTSNNVTNKTHNADREDFDNKKPVKIEDVPFR